MQPIQTQLTRLEQSGLIAIAKLLPELEYLFRHALVQDAAYESLLRKDRRVLHRSVAETLAATYADHPEHAATLAYHYHKAEDRERAHHYYWLAGQTALANYANAEAEQHFRSALLLAEDDSERLAAMRFIGIALQRQSRNQDALDTFQAAIALAAKLGDSNQLAHLYASLSQVKWYDSDTPGALAATREGLDRLGDPSTSEGMAVLLHEAARTSYFNGQAQAGLEYAERARDMADQLGMLSLKAEILITMGMLTPGLPNKGKFYLQGVELAEAQRHLRAAARGRVNLSALYGAMGNFEGAVEQSLLAHQLARRLGDVNMQIFGLQNSVESLLWVGRLEEADRLLDELAAIFASGVRPAWALAGHRGYSGLVLCHRGDWERGFPLVQGWQEDSRESGNLQMLAGIDLFYSEFLLQRGRLDESGRILKEAEAHLSEAVELSNKGVGMGPILPRCVLSSVYAAQGRLPDAHQLLGEIAAIAAQFSYPPDSGEILMAQARLALAEGRWQDAVNLYQGVLGWCERLKLLPYHALVLTELAQAALHLGSRDQAIAMLEQARSIYEGMNAPGYVDLVSQRLNALSQESAA